MSRRFQERTFVSKGYLRTPHGSIIIEPGDILTQPFPSRTNGYIRVSVKGRKSMVMVPLSILDSKIDVRLKSNKKQKDKPTVDPIPGLKKKIAALTIRIIKLESALKQDMEMPDANLHPVERDDELFDKSPNPWPIALHQTR